MSSEEPRYHVREARGPPSSRVKPIPKSSAIPAPFTYVPSDDGTDENLLILLHGLGDTHLPFAKLGRSLNLPQTAMLALRAPERIPYLYEDAYQWYESFDPLGALIASPNPTKGLDYMSAVLQHLTKDCGWPPRRIHVYGFAQGGSVATESALKWWCQHSQMSDTLDALGSTVSIAGPLLSYPTITCPCPTPILVFSRPPPASAAMPNKALAAFRKGFEKVTEVKKPGDGMPHSKEDWEPIMRFWSEQLGRRQMDGLYEVLSGINPNPT
ncbi:hypothetical protein K488DRAFT_39890 [Vararia minispora EC-137]|uniref:Uncharacterized protein n=1 Tax=Vararia minispora EC-137 TaxID=1314806 RepID=A0ACB8QZK3_9AGAM|nr:hypothetical protein K488DRAFT_39890 [Vararia minispora EC-137]